MALMGCAITDSGEAQGVDLGMSLGRGRAHLFKQGKVVGNRNSDCTDGIGSY